MAATIQFDEEPGLTLVARLQSVSTGATVGDASYSATEVASSIGNYQFATAVADGEYRISWFDTSISAANFLGSNRVAVVDGQVCQVGGQDATVLASIDSNAATAATQATAAALDASKIPRAASPTTPGAPQAMHLENASGDTLASAREVHDGDAA